MVNGIASALDIGFTKGANAQGSILGSTTSLGDSTKSDGSFIGTLTSLSSNPSVTNALSGSRAALSTAQGISKAIQSSNQAQPRGAPPDNPLDLTASSKQGEVGISKPNAQSQNLDILAKQTLQAQSLVAILGILSPNVSAKGLNFFGSNAASQGISQTLGLQINCQTNSASKFSISIGNPVNLLKGLLNSASAEDKASLGDLPQLAQGKDPKKDVLNLAGIQLSEGSTELTEAEKVLLSAAKSILNESGTGQLSVLSKEMDSSVNSPVQNGSSVGLTLGSNVASSSSNIPNELQALLDLMEGKIILDSSVKSPVNAQGLINNLKQQITIGSSSNPTATICEATMAGMQLKSDNENTRPNADPTQQASTSALFQDTVNQISNQVQATNGTLSGSFATSDPNSKTTSSVVSKSQTSLLASTSKSVGETSQNSGASSQATQSFQGAEQGNLVIPANKQTQTNASANFANGSAEIATRGQMSSSSDATQSAGSQNGSGVGESSHNNQSSTNAQTAPTAVISLNQPNVGTNSTVNASGVTTVTSNKTVNAVIQQTADRIQLLAASKSTKEVTIYLQPKDLGNIALSVKSIGNDIQAVINATNPQVRQILGDNKAQLSSALQKNGYALTDVRVNQQAPTTPSNSNHQNQQFGDRGFSSFQSQSQSRQNSQPKTPFLSHNIISPQSVFEPRINEDPISSSPFMKGNFYLEI